MNIDRIPTTGRLKVTCKGVRTTVVDIAIYAHIEIFLTCLGTIYKDRNMKRLYNHLKGSVGLGEG